MDSARDVAEDAVEAADGQLMDALGDARVGVGVPSGYPRVCWGNETEGISKSAEETEREERCRRRRRRCRV